MFNPKKKDYALTQSENSQPALSFWSFLRYLNLVENLQPMVVESNSVSSSKLFLSIALCIDLLYNFGVSEKSSMNLKKYR